MATNNLCDAKKLNSELYKCLSYPHSESNIIHPMYDGSIILTSIHGIWDHSNGFVISNIHSGFSIMAPLNTKFISFRKNFNIKNWTKLLNNLSTSQKLRFSEHFKYLL